MMIINMDIRETYSYTYTCLHIYSYTDTCTNIYKHIYKIERNFDRKSKEHFRFLTAC